MSWAAWRRLVIISVLGAGVIALVAAILIASTHRAPSCVDGVRNQGEEGVDCGGPCPYLCTASEQPPTVLYTKVLDNGSGRSDVIAAIENKNAAAAKQVPYVITLYGPDRSSAGEINGTVDLPPAATVPVFVPGVGSGGQKISAAFLSLNPAAPRWYALSEPRVVPIVTDSAFSGTHNSPRIDATLSNQSTTPLRDVRVVVMVHDASGNVIAASQTIVPAIPAQGQATATFTWSAAFSGTPVSVEAVPVISLP